MSDAPSPDTRAPARSSLQPAQLLAAVFALGLVALLAWWMSGPAGAGPVIAKAGGTCVAPPDEIRRSHPDLLRHQRDLTVHEGVRGAKVSLEACVNCHATPVAGQAGGVRSMLGGPQQFCQGCHSFAAVKVDCFQCHASVPSGAGHPNTAPVTARRTTLPLGPLAETLSLSMRVTPSVREVAP